MSDYKVPLKEEQIERAWSLLNEDGYFNDENSGLGSVVLEHQLDVVEAALRKRGYDGARLAHSGHHYASRGAVYWAYDPDRLTHNEARALTDEWVKRQPRR